ncbi:hypothetical protein ACGFMM_33120 [Streptomyces sp. NPDC048604]|uniref:hypothetical protein n=1 Tax=Streptomyces sp. NPDC048604 TaxID=3365578 RepID=UPI00371EE79E
MHRTRTTTKVLAGMAGVVGVTVAAVTGCVSVEPPAAPPVPAPAGVELPAGPAEPQVVVEAPAREALESVDPPERAVAPPPRRKAAERDRGGSQEHEADRPRRLPHQRDWTPGGRPPVVLPPVLPKLPVRPPRSRGQVCDMGEKYGGWGRGSDQSRICRDTYGDGGN